MNISPVNYSTQGKAQSFQGGIGVKGQWTEQLFKTFTNNPEVKRLAESSSYDIIGTLEHRTLSKAGLYNNKGDRIYKLSLSAQKAKPTFLDKVKNFFGLNPKVNVSKTFHTEDTTESIINSRISADKYKRLLKID